LSDNVELPSTCSEMSEVDQSDMLGVDILALDQPGQTLHLPDGTVAVIKNLTQRQYHHMIVLNDQDCLYLMLATCFAKY